MVTETDSVRDRKKNTETEQAWDTLMRERKKETVNRSCLVSPGEKQGGNTVHQVAHGNGTSISPSLIHAPCL